MDAMTIPTSYWSSARVLGHLTKGVHKTLSFLLWLTLLSLSSHVRNSVKWVEVMTQRMMTQRPREDSLMMGFTIDRSVAEDDAFPQLQNGVQPVE